MKRLFLRLFLILFSKLEGNFIAWIRIQTRILTQTNTDPCRGPDLRPWIKGTLSRERVSWKVYIWCWLFIEYIDSFLNLSITYFPLVFFSISLETFQTLHILPVLQALQTFQKSYNLQRLQTLQMLPCRPWKSCSFGQSNQNNLCSV